MTTAPASKRRRREPAPVWREQPPCMAVMILAGTGPTPKAARYLRELETWLRGARRQMPKADDNAAGEALMEGEQKA